MLFWSVPLHIILCGAALSYYEGQLGVEGDYDMIRTILYRVPTHMDDGSSSFIFSCDRWMEMETDSTPPSGHFAFLSLGLLIQFSACWITYHIVAIDMILYDSKRSRTCLECVQIQEDPRLETYEILKISLLYSSDSYESSIYSTSQMLSLFLLWIFLVILDGHRPRDDMTGG